jgi:hypothetical protein
MPDCRIHQPAAVTRAVAGRELFLLRLGGGPKQQALFKCPTGDDAAAMVVAVDAVARVGLA